MKNNETKPDTDLLQSIIHNSEIGVISINDIITETDSKAMKEELKKQKNEFKEIAKKAKQLALDFNVEVKPNNPLKKAKMWLSIKASTFFNDETNHIAELMMFGNFMGAVNMIKSLADCSDAKSEIIKLARELKKLEENSINAFVPFLEKAKKWVFNNAVRTYYKLCWYHETTTQDFKKHKHTNLQNFWSNIFFVILCFCLSKFFEFAKNSA